jgi:hypothetical protein
MDEEAPSSVEAGGLSSVPLHFGAVDPRPPDHDRVCWASAVGHAKRLKPHAEWSEIFETAADRLTAGLVSCICSRQPRKRRGRR